MAYYNFKLLYLLSDLNEILEDSTRFEAWFMFKFKMRLDCSSERIKFKKLMFSKCIHISRLVLVTIETNIAL